MLAYYNDNDPFAASWLTNLMAGGLISPGKVDSRSIEDVETADLVGFRRHHFFAGIGGWELALQLAGWPEEWPVWTGSCPCQPFSQAGLKQGFTDVRHLWPAWFRLIKECRPPVIFGEQVASSLGYQWLDIVLADLEAAGYAVGAADLPAACVGAPHIRQRLWFAALGHPKDQLGRTGLCHCRPTQERGAEPCYTGDDVFLAHANPERLPPRQCQELSGTERHQERGAAEQCGNSPWADPAWLPCRDGKFRPTEPGLFPLAYGLPASLGHIQSRLAALGLVAEVPDGLGRAKRNCTSRLRAYGNAIVPQVAALFIRTVMDFLKSVEAVRQTWR